MMNEFNRLFMTSLTNVIRPSKCLLASLKPIQSILSRSATLPTRMVFTTSKFRLPFSFTSVVTESLLSMKAASWTSNVFTTPRTLFCNQIRTTFVWFSYLAFYPAFNRAEQLATLTSIRNIPTALATMVRWCFTPSSHPITFERTILGILATIKWVKCLPAYLARICNSIYSPIFTTHTYIIPQLEIEEKYCEIAAKRCSQSVMKLEI